jgi:hypothetical protein
MHGVLVTAPIFKIYLLRRVKRLFTIELIRKRIEKGKAAQLNEGPPAKHVSTESLRCKLDQRIKESMKYGITEEQFPIDRECLDTIECDRKTSIVPESLQSSPMSEVFVSSLIVGRNRW